MFLRTVRSGGHAYVQLVESFRPGPHEVPRHRVLASLGSLQKLRGEGVLLRLQKSLERLTQVRRYGPEDLSHEEAYEYGNVWLLERLWHEVGLEGVLRRHVENPSRKIDVVKHLKALVFNRCLDPKSRLGVMDWLPRQKIPQVEAERIEYLPLLRSLAYLARAKEGVERELTSRTLTLFDTDLRLMLYDLTSSYFEGTQCELAKHGHSRDHRRDKKQIVMGLVTTREGLPVRHDVFEGNTADRATVKGQVRRLAQEHKVEQTMFVGDRGMVSERNLFWIREEGWDATLGISLPEMGPYLKVIEEGKAGRGVDLEGGQLKVWEFEEEREISNGEKGEQKKTRRVDMRVVVCRNEPKVGEDVAFRDQQIEKAQRELGEIARRIQEGGIESRDEAVEKIALALARHKVKKWIGWTLSGKKRMKLKWERRVGKGEKRPEDGIWGVETTDRKRSAEEVVQAYKNLQVVERSFRTMKSPIRLRPIYVYNGEHVRGHVAVAVLAYLLERMIELKLRRKKIVREARRALEALGQIKLVKSRLGNLTVWGATRADPVARQLLDALGMGKPPSHVVEEKIVRGAKAEPASATLFPVESSLPRL